MSDHVLRFHVVVHPAEEGGYWGEVLELPGCGSQGESLDELLDNVRQAISAVTEVYREDGRSLPSSELDVQTVEVTVPA